MALVNQKRKKLILAIDDEEAILEVITHTLEPEGYEVLTSPNGEAGIKLFQDHWRDIDLVLLDYLMPGIMGDAIFECLQQIDPGVRVLLLTASTETVAKKIFAKGLRGYLTKPFYLNDLIERVRNEILAP